MNMNQYAFLQKTSIEMHDMLIQDEPDPISHSEIKQLRELLVPHGRIFGTRESHLQYIKLSADFFKAIREGRVIVQNVLLGDRSVSEVEILAPK